MENHDQSTATLPPTTPDPQPLVPQADPWRELEDLHRRMESLLHRTFGFDPKGFHRSGLREVDEPGVVPGIEPDIDIFENEREFLLYVALPGINPFEIDLQATETSLTLTAEIAAPFAGLPNADAYTTHHRRSRRSRHNRFHFAYRLPTDIRTEEIQASFRHGLLELHLPKRLATVGKPVAVSIAVDGLSQGQAVTSDLSTYRMQPPPRLHEGAPTHKMGAAYTPATTEDHTSKAQAIGERTESAPSSHEKREAPHLTKETGNEEEHSIAEAHPPTDADSKTAKL